MITIMITEISGAGGFHSVRYECVERPVGAFQEPVCADVIARMCCRAFGDEVPIESVVELPWGSYNNVYRVEPRSGPPVVLRVAPAPERQFRVEAALMRNEYAAAPYLAPIRDLLPRIVFADFTHEVINRDYLVETLLPGVPAPEGVGRYPRSQWSSLFHQIGAVTRRIHDVRGRAFGPVAGPLFATWSEATVAFFRTTAQDVRDAGHDERDLWELATEAERLAGILDEITEPRLLHGDGWTANFLVNPETAALTLTGVCDWDRAEWGDPLADWAIQRALLRPAGTERDAFWDGYGRPRSVADGVRQRIYQARHAVALRLDRIRLGRRDQIAVTYDEIGAILTHLRGV
ncbi:phosphotransferase family protein [Actinopolymorpha alba]|uniref:phosphotransferase family protein n=1 Tax=Actinopolymorpha alba TaxID=533267 RepID=UPI0003783135|nr:aminoglycoside phosphotransferase family protein [Actinopolymorpha alba]